MGLATIDPHNLVPRVSHLDPGNEVVIHIVRKSTPRFTRFPSLVLVRLVLTEIQRFKNVKIITKKCMSWDRSGRCVDCVGERSDGHTFLCKFWHFQMAVSCLLLGLFTPNLGIL